MLLIKMSHKQITCSIAESQDSERAISRPLEMKGLLTDMPHHVLVCLNTALDTPVFCICYMLADCRLL